MSVRWALRVVVAAALLSCSSFFQDARADTKRVLFIVQRSSPFSARLQAEIEAMGFEIVPAEAFDQTAPAPAVAAVRVIELPPPRRVELWLAEGASGKLVRSTVVQPSEKDDEASQAVRASEQLRAFFQPLREPNPEPSAKSAPASPSVPRAVPEPSAGTTSASPKPAAPKRAPETPARRPPARSSSELRSIAPASFDAERAPGRRRMEVAASAAMPLGTGGPGLDALLNARWLLTSRLGVGLVLDVPIVKSTLSSGVNSANVSAVLAGAELSVALFDSRALRLTAIGGVALAWIRTEGEATPPYTSESDDAWAALPLVGAELAPRLSERLYASLAARAGVTSPKPDIEFAGEHVATWGQPLVLLSAGIGMHF
jgi:hypothetical protein